MDKQIRVRFAPSPTGNLHVGGLRTALFNWLFARHHKGSFLLRIEDTDLERSSTEFMQSQLASLSWTGIESDEPLVYQSQRTQIYTDVLQKLLTEKKVYKCFCTQQEIENRAAVKHPNQEFYPYDGFCKTRKDAPNVPFVIRFALPENCPAISFTDLIRGPITVEADQLDDFIIIRSDGSFTYNFVVVIDDHAMNISHVIRAEEHISNTPKQILLYQACNFPVPLFAHIPMILGPDGSKLSKRDGAVDVLSYKKNGYLPDALLNYLVRLGWAYKDQELFTVQEMIDLFSLEGVGKKGAIFDIQKLNWVNSTYIKAKSAQELLTLMEEQLEFLVLEVFPNWSLETTLKAIDLYKERIKTLKELCDTLSTLYTGPVTFMHNDVEEYASPALLHLQAILEQLNHLDQFDVQQVSTLLKTYCKEQKLPLAKLAHPLRLALTGTITSPGIFELLALVGKDTVTKRVEALVKYAATRPY